MRITILLLFAALLSGCLLLGTRDSEEGKALLDFGTPPAPLQEAGGQRGSVTLEVKAPQWLDGTSIHYRLSYADVSQLREYARTRWLDPPAQMVEQRLTKRLNLAATGQVRGKCVLRIDLAEFSQVFASPKDSNGVLQGHAVLLDAGRRPLADRSLKRSSPAATANARGGVAALQAAIDLVAEDLLAWEKELAASGALRACQT